MVRRDPDTGKFVSDSGGQQYDHHEMTTIQGSLGVEIPAADLSGGTTAHPKLEGEDTEIIDFTGVIGGDEAFEVVHARYNVVFFPGTTSSGQGREALMVEIGPTGALQMNNSPAFWQTDVENDVYDIGTESVDDTDVLHHAFLAGHSETKDGTGASGSGTYMRDAATVPYKALTGGMGPTFDQDDELFAPLRMWTDAVSNHAAEAFITVNLSGKVWEA